MPDICQPASGPSAPVELIHYVPIGRFLTALANGWHLSLDRHGDAMLPPPHGVHSVLMCRPVRVARRDQGIAARHAAGWPA